MRTFDLARSWVGWISMLWRELDVDSDCSTSGDDGLQYALRRTEIVCSSNTYM